MRLHTPTSIWLRRAWTSVSDVSTFEDGRLAHCWSCGIDHYTIEDEAPKDRHWRDLCHVCIAEYFEGRERGAQAVIEGRSDFERRALPSVMRLGYMSGRFLQAAAQSRNRKKTEAVIAAFEAAARQQRRRKT